MAPEASYGLAMHGDAKYGAQDSHLSYVNPDAPKGGHFKTAAARASFDTLNPFALKGTAADGLHLIYDRLMARVWDEAFTMYPLIAERAEVAQDRSWITFHIDPDARFSDGSPITPADVMFSFETLREHGRPNMRRIYKLVETVRQEDASVRFELGDGYDRETVMILALMPVLSKAYWEGRDFEATLLEPPVTNGPYRIQSVDAGRSITYARDPDYWAKDLLANKGQYNFDQITYEYFRDDTVALEAFNKGELNYRYESDISKWMKAYSDDARIVKYEAPHERPEKAIGFIFNTRRAPFDDIAVRKALSLAFDAEWIGQNIYFGSQKRIHGFFANSALSGEQGTDSENTSFRNDLRKASQVLSEAGWTITDGLRMKNGQVLSFEVILSKPEEEKIALNFKKHLERLGITMNIRVLDSASFQARRNDYDYDMILHSWQNSLSPGTEQVIYWSCEAAEQPGRFNYAGICDAEIDRLAAAIADAQSYEELSALTQTLDRALIAQTIQIPFFYSGIDRIAHDAALRHPPTTPIYGNVIETWWMEPRE